MTLIYKLTIILMMIYITSCASGVQERGGLPPISYTTYVTHPFAFSIKRLHQLKIGEARQLERNLERSLASDAKVLALLTKQKELVSEEIVRIEELLRLLSVMNEKFEVPEWRNDIELQNILKTMQEADPEHTRELRCYNWSKAMWVDRDGCS